VAPLRELRTHDRSGIEGQSTRFSRGDIGPRTALHALVSSDGRIRRHVWCRAPDSAPFHRGDGPRCSIWSPSIGLGRFLLEPDDRHQAAEDGSPPVGWARRLRRPDELPRSFGQLRGAGELAEPLTMLVRAEAESSARRRHSSALIASLACLSVCTRVGRSSGGRGGPGRCARSRSLGAG